MDPCFEVESLDHQMFPTHSRTHLHYYHVLPKHLKRSLFPHSYPVKNQNKLLYLDWDNSLWNLHFRGNFCKILQKQDFHLFCHVWRQRFDSYCMLFEEFSKVKFSHFIFNFLACSIMPTKLYICNKIVQFLFGKYAWAIASMKEKMRCLFIT